MTGSLSSNNIGSFTIGWEQKTGSLSSNNIGNFTIGREQKTGSLLSNNIGNFTIGREQNMSLDQLNVYRYLCYMNIFCLVPMMFSLQINHCTHLVPCYKHFTSIAGFKVLLPIGVLMLLATIYYNVATANKPAVSIDTFIQNYLANGRVNINDYIIIANQLYQWDGTMYLTSA